MSASFKWFFRQFLLLLGVKQMAGALFRLIAAVGRSMIVANIFGSFALLTILVLGGFILSKDAIRPWWIWGYWISPLMYGQNAISANEYLGKSWQHVNSTTGESLGVAVMEARSLFPHAYWYWLGVGALVGFTFLFNALFTVALIIFDRFGKSQAVVSEETFKEKHASRTGEILQSASQAPGDEIRRNVSSGIEAVANSIQNERRGMILPFSRKR